MKRIFTTLIGLISGTMLLAQISTSNNSLMAGYDPDASVYNTGDQCKTDERHQFLYNNDPEYRQSFEHAKRQIQNIINSGIRLGGVYTIPVVVHVIHLGSAEGSGPNISDAQIQSAIDNMNDAYANIGYNGLDVEIQFALAQRDPFCQPTDGILRVNGSGVTGGGDNYSTVGITSNNETTIKALSKWPNGEYYNIWIVTEIDNNNGGAGTQGYAYFPGASSTYDGAVILYNAFGYDPTGALGYNLKSYTNYNVTTIHELGHGLNLYHTFEGDGSGSTCPTNTSCSTQGDLCCDTDPHRRNDGTDCEAPVPVTCGGISNSVVYNNFMAYSSDYCQDRFTADQKTRMRAALEGTRLSLINSLGDEAISGTEPSTAQTCQPQTTDLANNFGMGIFSFTMDNLVVGSGSAVSDGGYVEKWCANTTLDVNTNYAIEVVNNTSVGNPEDVRVYIDYNNDGDFVDAGETIFTSNALTTHTGNFTTPASPVTGQPIWVRVISDWQGNTISGPCYTPQYGQVEDYSITINAGNPPPVADFTANFTSICQNGSVTFTDASANSTSWSWNFGSGASPATAAGQGPHAVTYSTSGTKTVTLDVTGPGGNDNETKTNYITVNANVTPSVNIVSNDADNIICSGTNVTFTATPTNGGPSPSYQWKLNGGNVGTNSSTYANSSLANGDQVTVVLTSNANCASPTTANGNTITMTVNPTVTPSVSVVSDDADNTICSGTNVIFTAIPTNGGASPSYQWKLNGGNVGANSSTYANSSLANGDQVSVVLTSNANCASPTTANGNTITMTVNPTVVPSVSVVSDDADNSICIGTNVTFTATPTNGGSSPSYQWKLNGGNVGTNSSTYANSSLANGDQVSVVLTSNANCASPTTTNGNTITMTVNSSVTPSVSIVSDDADNTICSGTNVTFTATPTNGGSSPSYQWKLNGGNVGTNSATYANSALSNGDQVSVVLTSSDACASPTTANGNTITMTVNPSLTPSVSISASANPINSGDPVTFTATPTNGGSSPSYQWKLNGGNVGTNSSTYNNSSLNNGDQVSCEMTSNAACASPGNATSNTITMIVNSPVSCTSDGTGPAGIGSSATNRIWLDASTLNLVDGNPVAYWIDRSGNNLVANSPSGYNRPTYRTSQLNGFPSLSFDGTNDFIRIPDAPGIENQEISWFMVGNFNTTSRSQALLHFAHYGSSYRKNLRFTLCYNNGTINRINSGNLNTSGGGVPALHSFSTNTQIFSTVITTNTINAFSNGNSTGSNSGNFISPPNSNAFVTIGKRAYLNDMYLDGNVAEVIVFNYDLNVAERTIVENYLSSKYNLAISNDKYSFEGSGHYYDLAGIGMENNDIVSDAEGTSGVRISSPSLLENNDYLLWAHNNATTASTNVGTPAAYGGTGVMLTRNWRADKTNDVGTVTITFNLDGIATGASTDFELLVDTDGDFSNATRITSGFSYDGSCDIATWTGVNLSDGNYFTIGNPDGMAIYYAPAGELAVTGEDDENLSAGEALEVINPVTEELQMKLYPNPTQGLLTIDNLVEGSAIEIYNTLGEVVYHATISLGKNNFDFGAFVSGAYIVHLKDASNQSIAISQLMIVK